MNKIIKWSLFVLLIVFVAFSQKCYAVDYRVSPKPWHEGLGNHRALLYIDQKCDVAELNIIWRRHDADVNEKRFLIVNSVTGDTVKNILRINVNNEKCNIKFGPIEERGEYYFYYLPYVVQNGMGYYGGGYAPKETNTNKQWSEMVNKTKEPQQAKLKYFESRTAFDSFYPMEVTALNKEKKAYLENNIEKLYVFSEDRKYPVRMKDNIPFRWLSQLQGNINFKGSAQPNEYYVFQLSLWAAKERVLKVKYTATDFVSGSNKISSKSVTCFNLEGVDPYGEVFTKTINVDKDQVQTLWFGVDIPKGQKKGVYKGCITLSDADGNKRFIPIEIAVSGKDLEERGDTETWRHSRLRWLNSTRGISDKPTFPYTDVINKGEIIQIYGRSVEVDKHTGLPSQINSWSHNLFSSPMGFVIETKNGIKKLKLTLVADRLSRGKSSKKWIAEDDDLKLILNADFEYDGWGNYVYKLLPKRNVEIVDVRVELNVDNRIAQYFMGVGLSAQKTPLEYKGGWESKIQKVNNYGVSTPINDDRSRMWAFDSFWIGNANAGLHLELRGTTYSGPLLNLYRPEFPMSWYNKNKGGFKVYKNEKSTRITIFSGERKLEKGKIISFDFAMIVTPVKKTNFKSQFTDRYYHNLAKPLPSQEDVNAGVKIINIHHATIYNPFINYPFLRTEMVKQLTNEWHKKGCKVKLYYTLRELTSSTTELWALRSLGDEVLRDGKGGGYPWCREHMVSNYTPQWYHHLDQADASGISADAAILTSERESRWYNYYIEGLAWMVKHLDIDGIYLDDVSFDRRILKRMKSVMDEIKKGCLIDLHSNTGFSIGPAIQYADFFPYVDKLWFGESFQYNKMSPVSWLVEASGIPFGLTSDMLQAGGNKWLGMQYGMTVRYPWLTDGVLSDPRPIWKICTEFGIEKASVNGFWEETPLAYTNDDNVKITTYVKTDGKILLSLGNYSDDLKHVSVIISSRLKKMIKSSVMKAPKIDGFQPEARFNLSDEIIIEPRKGKILLLN